MALCLTRKFNESIQIGPDIIITVAEIRNGRVRLAITAPENVTIMRTELIGTPEADKHIRPTEGQK